MITNYTLVFDAAVQERLKSDPRFRQYGCVARALSVPQAVLDYHLSRYEAPAPSDFPENLTQYLSISDESLKGYILSRHLERANRIEATLSLCAGHYINVIVRVWEHGRSNSSFGLNVDIYDDRVSLGLVSYAQHPDDPKEPREDNHED